MQSKSCCLLLSVDAVATSLISEVKIPPYVILGSTVHLYCSYDLPNGTDLYMLKWLKEEKEFYRSVPKDPHRQNRRRTFQVPGVKVDIENSKVTCGCQKTIVFTPLFSSPLPASKTWHLKSTKNSQG